MYVVYCSYNGYNRCFNILPLDGVRRPSGEVVTWQITSTEVVNPILAKVRIFILASVAVSVKA